MISYCSWPNSPDLFFLFPILTFFRKMYYLFVLIVSCKSSIEAVLVILQLLSMVFTFVNFVANPQAQTNLDSLRI